MLKKIANSGLIWLWVTIVAILLDRYTKCWAADHLIYGEPLRLLPVFNLTLAHNTGAAFSFLHTMSGWQNIVLGGLAFLVSVIVIIWLATLPARAKWLSIALCLILSGALGNAWDRLLYGYVIDFLSFHWGNWHFAIFNVADSAITVGACMLFWHWYRQSYPAKK